jgi:uncharacterized protein YukE
MQKLIEVEEARALMNVAKDWSVWRWLTEKKRVRQAADRAVDALDAARREVKDGWSGDLHKAYAELLPHDSKRQHEKAKKDAEHIDAKIKAAANRVKDADDEAEAARLDAEETFEAAERRLSASLAREGARKALDSWDLKESAIRKAETAKRVKAG